MRKIEFSWVGVGIYLCGDNCTVEDCFFTHCYRGGMFFHGRTNIVRRCNFYRCGNAMHGSGSGVGHIVEDNLIVDCSLRAEDDILPLDIPGCMPEGYPPTCFKGNMLSQLFIHNILSENPGGGWYADCPGVQSSRVIGNAFWDNPGGGIYNEAMVNDSVTQGNVFYRNGIGSSVATRWNLIDNLFFEGGIFWNNLDINPMRDGYMLLAPQRLHQPAAAGLPDGLRLRLGPVRLAGSVPQLHRRPQPHLAGQGRLSHHTTGPGSTRRSTRSARSSSGNSTAKSCPTTRSKDTVESVAKAMGGNVVTFRIPWGKHSGEARPMLASVRGNCPWPGAVLSTDTSVMPCYFWRVADGNYDADPLLDGYARFALSRLLAGHLRRRTRERASRLPLVLRRRGQVPCRP